MDGILRSISQGFGQNNKTYVVTWKGFSFDDNLMSFLCWPIEAGEKKMQIGCQSLHHNDFASLGADNLCHCLAGLVININPWQGVLVGKRLEVSVDAFLAPGIEILIDVLPRALRLKSKRVATQIRTASWIVLNGIVWRELVLFRLLDGCPSSCQPLTDAVLREDLSEGAELVVVPLIFVCFNWPFVGTRNSALNGRSTSFSSRSSAYSCVNSRSDKVSFPSIRQFVGRHLGLSRLMKASRT